jgi:uncharacterized membrane protein
MKTNLLVVSVVAVAAVAGYMYFNKQRKKKMKANRKPDGMMNADAMMNANGDDRQKRRQQRREDRAQRRENARIMYEYYQRNRNRF